MSEKKRKLGFVSGSLRLLGKAGKKSAKIGAAGYVAGGVIAKALGGFVSPEDQTPSNTTLNETSGPGDPGTQSDTDTKPSFPALKDIKAREVIVKPKLGPLEGKYAAHLNLIIIRQAKLESAVSTQNNLIKEYNNLINKMLDQNRREDLAKRRKEDEEDLESKNKQSLFQNMKESYEKNSDSILKTLAKIAAGGLAAGGLIGLATGDIDLSGENILNTIADAVDTVDTATTTFTETVAPGAAALAGARAGTAVTGAVNTAKRADRKLARADKVAAAKGEAPAKRTIRQRVNSTVVKAADTVAKPLTRLADPYAIRNEMARTGNTALASRAAKAQKLVDAVRKMEDIITGLQSKADKVKGFLSKASWLIPDSIKNALGKVTPGKIIKWYLIIEAFVFMKNAASAFAEGKLSEEEWHEQNKDQLNRILGGIGGPYLTAFILGSAGTVIPVIGNLVGGFAGFIVGLILGDRIYKLLQIDDLVDALYDAMGDDKTLGQALKSFASKVISDFKDTIGLGDDESKAELAKNDAKPKSGELRVSVLTNDGFKDLTKSEIQQGKKDGTIKRSIANAALQEIKLLESNKIEATSNVKSGESLDNVEFVENNTYKLNGEEVSEEMYDFERSKMNRTTVNADGTPVSGTFTVNGKEVSREEYAEILASPPPAPVASGKIKPTQNKPAEVKTEKDQSNIVDATNKPERVAQKSESKVSANIHLVKLTPEQFEIYQERKKTLTDEYAEKAGNNRRKRNAAAQRAESDTRNELIKGKLFNESIEELIAQGVISNYEKNQSSSETVDSVEQPIKTSPVSRDVDSVEQPSITQPMEQTVDSVEQPIKTSPVSRTVVTEPTSPNEKIENETSSVRANLHLSKLTPEQSKIYIERKKTLGDQYKQKILEENADKPKTAYVRRKISAGYKKADSQAMNEILEGKLLNESIDELIAQGVITNYERRSQPKSAASESFTRPIEQPADVVEQSAKPSIVDDREKIEEIIEMDVPEVQMKELLSTMNTGIRSVTNLVPIMMPIVKRKKSLTKSAGANGPSKQGTSALSYVTRDSFITQHTTT